MNIIDANNPINLTFQPAIVYPFECDPFQKHSFISIHNGNDLFVSVPTSSGKTMVAEYAIANTILKMGKKVIYTSPIKSLSNEKYNDFKIKFKEYGISVGLLTGDNKIDVDSTCLIMTAEILRNTLYTTDNDFINSVGCVIMDEIHFMNDDERGKVWEESIILLNKNIQLIMLSATVRSPEKFADWVSQCREKQIDLITLTKRIIPLKHYIFTAHVPDDTQKEEYNIFQFLDSDVFSSIDFKKAENIYTTEKKKRINNPINDTTIVPKLVKYLKQNDMLQTIFFSFSRKNCELYAKSINFNLTSPEESKEIELIFYKYLDQFIKKHENVSQLTTIKNLLLKGIAFHHSGMLPILKEIVEIIFKKGLIKVLFATETFAVGVNTPTRTVVFTELEKYTGKGKRFITAAEYKQMSGRAGRRGLDTNGNVIILPLYDLPEERQLRSIVLGVLPEIISKFKWDYQFFLKIMQSSTIDLKNFFNKSLLMKINETNKKLLYHDLEATTEQIDNIENLVKNDENIETLLKYDNLINDAKTNGFSFKMNGKQKNLYTKARNIVSADKSLNEIYTKASNKNQLMSKRKNIQEDIKIIDNYVQINYDTIMQILTEWNYVRDSKIQLKGIIASQINDCDAIIMTEIIYGDYLCGMSSQEIIAFVSIFIDPIKSNSSSSITNFTATKLIHDKINQLITQCDKLKEIESKYVGNNNTFSNWLYSTDYIDITYKWGSGCSVECILTMLNEYEEYEGNFVRNMLKISNILTNMQNIYKMIGKTEILPTIENTNQLIIRDIVTVSSLYY